MTTPQVPRIIGADIAEKYGYDRVGASALGWRPAFSSGPDGCSLCGRIDCTGEDMAEEKAKAAEASEAEEKPKAAEASEAEEKPKAAPRRAAADDNAMVRVTQEVQVDVPVPYATTKTRVVAFAAGSVVRKGDLLERAPDAKYESV